MVEWGRDDAVVAAVEALRDRGRVAIVGPVGSGRSTVARAALTRLGRSWPTVQGLHGLSTQPRGAFQVVPGWSGPAGSETTLRQRLAAGLLVEDAHLLDTASLALVVAAPTWLATCRSDARATLRALSADVVVRLPALDPVQARRLARRALGPAATRTLDAVHAASGGRPRLLTEVTGRGRPSALLEARLRAVVDDLPGTLQDDLAVLGASAETIRLEVGARPVPSDLLADPVGLVDAELACEADGGLLPSMPALALVAHRRGGAPERDHRRLAENEEHVLVRVAHDLLAGDDPRRRLDDGRVAWPPDPTEGVGWATVLAAMVEHHPEDEGLAARAFDVALDAGHLELAGRLAAADEARGDRLRREIDGRAADTAGAAGRRARAMQAGALGWRLEAEVDLLVVELARRGPSPTLASRLLSLLDDPWLHRSRVRATTALVRVLAWLGRDGDARRTLAHLRALGVDAREVEAELHWVAGRDHAAAAIAGTTYAGFAVATSGGRVVASMDDAEAQALACLQDRPVLAAAALLRLADDAPEVTLGWARRHTAILALEASGDREAAAQQRGRLDRELADRRAAALLRRRGGVADGPASRPGGLTRREHEVMLLVGEGLTSAQIAHHLGIGRATVETHVAAAMRRLGASSRLEAVARVASS